MKTRVIRWYWLQGGIELYRIEIWKEAYEHKYLTMGGDRSFAVPASWHLWPTGMYKDCFQTADREEALRIAQELSEGKNAEAGGAIAEFSDGVQFSAIK